MIARTDSCDTIPRKDMEDEQTAPVAGSPWKDVLSWTPEQVLEEAHIYLGLLCLAVGVALIVFGAGRFLVAHFYSGLPFGSVGIFLAILGAGLFLLGWRK